MKKVLVLMWLGEKYLVAIRLRKEVAERKLMNMMKRQ
jgi:hypothetical protein